ncbi:sugar ABC transporter ATP-binding protein [Nocardioides alkalitolerans]|uniref:sugar ABC transporter ATP-binding protein n=1 Tax=Nocardioides alkalitolerans TaxID=281714 RepID=UPI0004202434|nr:sugar ABC transporter ATP-binding protein [Nocardioides alkalitolerans]
MEAEGQARLQLAGVSKTFGAVRVLDDVSLDIAAGEVHALVGQNGSGKSTLIKVLAGFYQADPGATAVIDGAPRELGDPNDIHAAGVRFVHQDLGLVPALSVVDNLALGHGYARSQGMRINWREQRAAARRALAAVGYELDVRRLVDDLQPVERTAVAIARALQSAHGEMSILVLDEPTATMPKGEVQRLVQIVRAVRSRGVGVLYVSHHLEEVFELADRVTVLVDGQRVGTERCSQIDHKKLVTMMTGGVVDDVRRRAVGTRGKTMLSLERLSGAELTGLDLQVRAGEVVGVAGITGSGREEICSLVFGSKPRRGTVTVGDRELPPSRPDRSCRAGLALVPANRLRDGVVIGLNVRENLNITTTRGLAKFSFIRPGLDRRQAAALGTKMSVKAPSLDASIEALSGGNQQKVVLGKWLQTNPSVLLLDEPTQGVDISAKAEIHRLIDDAVSQGLAVLVCSSDEAELERLCDRVVVLREGRAVAEVAAPDIRTRQLIHLSLGLTA